MNLNIIILVLVSLSFYLSSRGLALNNTRNVCPSGWQQYKDKCYTITSTQINPDWSGGLSWASADSLCKQLSATLVKIESIDENSFIHDWYQNIRPRPNIPFCIGAKRINGVIKWQDGTSLKYSNWYSGQPDGDGDCIEVVPKGANGNWPGHPAAVWNDYPCSGGRGVVCQMPANSGKCTCHYGSGNYCGSRKSSEMLAGDCNQNELYYCPGANGLPASSKGECAGFCLEIGPGVDSCPNRDNNK